MHSFEVNKELYEKVKESDLVEMHFAKYSNLLLSIEFKDKDK